MDKDSGLLGPTPEEFWDIQQNNYGTYTTLILGHTPEDLIFAMTTVTISNLQLNYANEFGGLW
jgi:hypothetical protein